MNEPTHTGHWWWRHSKYTNWKPRGVVKDADGISISGPYAGPISPNFGEWGPEARPDDAQAREEAVTLLRRLQTAPRPSAFEQAQLIEEWLKQWEVEP